MAEMIFRPLRKEVKELPPKEGDEKY